MAEYHKGNKEDTIKNHSHKETNKDGQAKALDLVLMIKPNEIGEAYKDETKEYPSYNQHDKVEYIRGEEQPIEQERYPQPYDKAQREGEGNP